MIASSLFRPAALALTAMLLSGCSVEVQNDGHMFQRWADQVGNIPVSETPPGESSPQVGPQGAAAPAATQTADNTLDPMALNRPVSAQAAGLRPAMVIDVVDRIDMPNAKEAGMRAIMGMAQKAIAGADHKSGDALGLRRAMDAAPDLMRGMAHAGAPARPAPQGGHVIQLAAFSNEAAAHNAWRTLSAAHPDLFKGVAPKFERADLGAKGKWTRLKVQVGSVAAAQRVCAAAGVRCA